MIGCRKARAWMKFLSRGRSSGARNRFERTGDQNFKRYSGIGRLVFVEANIMQGLLMLLRH